MVELRGIEIFLALARELHFGRTAERLHITTARVSQSIRKAERRVGGLLFERNSRTVRLTLLGEQLQQDLSAGYRQTSDSRGTGHRSRPGSVPAGRRPRELALQRAAPASSAAAHAD